MKREKKKDFLKKGKKIKLKRGIIQTYNYRIVKQSSQLRDIERKGVAICIIYIYQDIGADLERHRISDGTGFIHGICCSYMAYRYTGIRCIGKKRNEYE